MFSNLSVSLFSDVLVQIPLRLASYMQRRASQLYWDMLAIGHQGRSLEPHGRRYLANILHPKPRRRKCGWTRMGLAV